jgi:hypothetical protein
MANWTYLHQPIKHNGVVDFANRMILPPLQRDRAQGLHYPTREGLVSKLSILCRHPQEVPFLGLEYEAQNYPFWYMYPPGTVLRLSRGYPHVSSSL